ncbi:MAG: transcriptional regulator [Armatimonadetes bacterium]|nr:transcriptional regulator [Armatimonadota bacterium]
MVALPFCHIVLHAQKPLPAGYPKEVRTIGDHIKKARLERRLPRAGAAKVLGVSMDSIKNWEANITLPSVKLMPKVIEFLGYVPCCNIDSLSEGDRIRTCRKILGLRIREAAEHLGVSMSTLSSWENGRDVKRVGHTNALDRFISAARLVGRNSR